MIAVQVKTTKEGRYAGESEEGFHYLLRSEDLAYWRPSNLPVIIVLYRESDESFYWKEIPRGDDAQERRLTFSKRDDLLDRDAADRVAALTVPKAGFGYYVPPLGGGEEALVNILPIKLPSEVFVATTSYNARQANSILLQDDEPARFDWAIKGGAFWSFHDPRTSVCRSIVDIDQVEAIDTAHLAFHDDVNERNTFAYLLRQTLDHQVRGELSWSKENGCFYFSARAEYTTRVFRYESSVKMTEAEVVNAIESKREVGSIAFVRHHAFVPRFESFYDEWYLVVEPTYMERVIGTALRKKSPAEIPTSGERALQNDCYSQYLLDSAGEARLSIRDIDGTEVHRKWSTDGQNFTEDRTIPLAELSNYTLYVQHYYRGWTFYSIGLPKFLRYQWSRWPWIRVTFDRFLQTKFNRKELTRQDRMKALEYVLSETIKDRAFQTHPTGLMTHLYTARWVRREDKDELMNYYTFILDALKESGDLASTQHNGYRLTAKALNTVTAHAEEDRRHNDNKNIQTWIVMLTIALTMIGGIQAGAAAYEQWLKPPESFTGTIGNIPITLQQK